MVLVWQITDDSPNSPNFLPAKLSRYTVYGDDDEHKGSSSNIDSDTANTLFSSIILTICNEDIIIIDIIKIKRIKK